MKHILKCKKCSGYSMNQICKCGGESVSPKPQKYSPEDKYGNYRRKVKEEELKNKGLL